MKQLRTPNRATPGWSWLPRAAATVLLAAALVALGVSTGEADEKDEAGQFLAQLTADAIEQLTDSDVPAEERKARFRALFKKNFDLPAIGRFVVGRYWNQASPEAREMFLEAFEDVMVERFVPQFSGYVGTNFRVVMVREVQEEGQYIVSSTISPPGEEDVRIDWRVREKGGEFRVIDVIGEGVSMALTLRSEYASVIKRSGGRLEGLTVLLRERAQQDAGLADAAEKD